MWHRIGKKKNLQKKQSVCVCNSQLAAAAARERAGYVSFTREAIPSVSFYFSQKVCGTKYFNLSEKSERNDWENTQTALDQYFYNGFAQASQKEDEIYRDFQKRLGSI